MQSRAVSPRWSKIASRCDKVTDKSFIASAEHCKSLPDLNVGRLGKVADATENDDATEDDAVPVTPDAAVHESQGSQPC